ncbi:MAG: phosphatidylglycerol:prolipoprotein diacylglycerol transferase [Gammaproteobacteria bacterium]|jgi:phosphatidylglycerol:prolipoprotein diacylglycerol transferase
MINFPNIDPVALDLGILQIRWYGISYICGILLAWWLLRHRAMKNPMLGWTSAQVSDLIYYGTLGVILGGRLGSVIFYNAPYYLANPLDILKVWQGGMSFHGGLLGVAVAAWYYSRKINQGFFETTDFLIPVVPVGLFFGRIANFINAELWGAPTTLPWGIVFPDAGGIARHPSQLYEALLEGVVLFIIIWWYSMRLRPKMAVSGAFLLGYGVFRSSVELVREPDANIGYLLGEWLTMGQVLSSPMILIGSTLLFLAYSKNRKTANK